jgi:hypothetical protein
MQQQLLQRQHQNNNTNTTNTTNNNTNNTNNNNDPASTATTNGARGNSKRVSLFGGQPLGGTPGAPHSGVRSGSNGGSGHRSSIIAMPGHGLQGLHQSTTPFASSTPHHNTHNNTNNNTNTNNTNTEIDTGATSYHKRAIGGGSQYAVMSTDANVRYQEKFCDSIMFGKNRHAIFYFEMRESSNSEKVF